MQWGLGMHWLNFGSDKSGLFCKSGPIRLQCDGFYLVYTTNFNFNFMFQLLTFLVFCVLFHCLIIVLYIFAGLCILFQLLAATVTINSCMLCNIGWCGLFFAAEKKMPPVKDCRDVCRDATDLTNCLQHCHGNIWVPDWVLWLLVKKHVT